MRSQRRVELIEHHAGLHGGGHGFLVEGDDAIEPLAMVDDQGFAHGLAALRGSRAAGEDRDVEITRDGERGLSVFLVARDQDRKSTRLNSSHTVISYAVFCLKKKKTKTLQS